MQTTNSWIRIARSLAGFLVILTLAGSAIVSAQSEHVLYNFQGGTNDGTNPSTSLVADPAGDLFGTTTDGGSGGCTGGCGTIFELKPT
jgi:hypothetical protein